MKPEAMLSVNTLKSLEIKNVFTTVVIYVATYRNKGYEDILKIGETLYTSSTPPSSLIEENKEEHIKAALKRVNSYANISGLNVEILYTCSACIAKQDKRKQDIVFTPVRDADIHERLKATNVFPVAFQGSTAKEWFRISLEDAKKAIKATIDGTPLEVGNAPKKRIILREEQEDAVTKTLNVFNSGKNNTMLWNAKMRFGKTLTTLELIRRAKYQRVLLVTHRPVVNKGWGEDCEKIFLNKEYEFGRCEALKEGKRYPVAPIEEKGKPFIFFASLQDLRGSRCIHKNPKKKKDGKIVKTYDKNCDVFTTQWDLLVIDEAHEGTQTEIAKLVFKNLKYTYKLELSGTPFNLMKKYTSDNIYTWDYIMEQRRKVEWNMLHGDTPNPYATLPAMRMYTYNLKEDLFLETESPKNSWFSFSEFFAVGDDDRFIHENDVKSFLDLLCDPNHGTMYPFTKDSFREMFKHTFWVIPGVKEGAALKALLKEHSYFEDYEIINVAGNEEHDDALDAVQKAIEDVDKGEIIRKRGTITLSCGKLTTGVTVPEWTAVFMLSGGSEVAASLYLQTIFRVQSTYTNPKTGQIKSICYVFDFAPDRFLRVIGDAIATVSYHTPQEPKDNIKIKIGTTINEEIAKAYLQYCPLIAVRGASLRRYDVQSMMRELNEIYINAAYEAGFDTNEIINSIEVDALTEEELKELTGKISKHISDGDLKKSGVDIAKTTGADPQKPRDGAQSNRKTGKPKQKDPLASLKQELKLLIRYIVVRLPLLVYGIEKMPYTPETFSLEGFLDIIDDASWKEFVPISKDEFLKLSRFLRIYAIAGAALKYRQDVEAVEGLAPEERIRKIVNIFSYFKNPDKETVLTPWQVVNRHLSDTIGGWCFFDETFLKCIDAPRFVGHTDITSNVFRKESQFLELNSKSGFYPLYIVFSLFKEQCNKLLLDGESLSIERQKEIWREIILNNIYIVCGTKMAQEITQTTLLGYQGGKANICVIKDIAKKMKEDQEKILKQIKNPKTWNKEGITAMEFDAIVGNPPYQAFLGGKSPLPIYHLFIDAAIRLNPSYVSMISPSRWFNTGSGLDEFRRARMDDKRMRVIHDFVNAQQCFSNVDIKGGINYFLWDKKYNGDVVFSTHEEGKPVKTVTRPLFVEGIDIFIRNEEMIAIYEKVKAKGERTFDDILSSRDPFGFDIRLEGSQKCAPHQYVTQKDKENNIEFYYNNWRKEGVGYVPRSRVSENTNWIDKYKVLIPKAWGTGVPGKDKLNGFIVKPGSVCTETYIVLGPFDTEVEAKNALAYTKTNFFLAMVSIRKTTQNAAKGVYQFVPLQDFSKPWTDEELYAKYGLTEEEIAFVESMIRPMEVADKGVKD